jgi:hypothetical protein
MKYRLLKTVTVLLAAAGILAAPQAKAALTFNLVQGNPYNPTENSGLTPNAPGPYGTVKVSLIDSTHATVTLTADQGYTFGDGSTLGLNLASAATIVGGASGVALTSYDKAASVSAVNYGTPQKPTDGWGKFNFSIDLDGAFGNSVTALSFELVNSSGTWTSVNDILTANEKGFDVVGHAMDIASQGKYTGFAVVPEPTTVIAGFGALGLLLFGAGVHSKRSVLRIGK